MKRLKWTNKYILYFIEEEKDEKNNNNSNNNNNAFCIGEQVY